MPNFTDALAFKACYIQYQKSDADRDILFSQLLEGYDFLLRENVTLHQQLENEKETRAVYQGQARAYRKEATQARLATESHPFVVMIIDGDGAKFRDEFFNNGDHGGGHAAQELKKQIRSYLRDRYPNSNVESWNIIVNFYANMDGLSRALTTRRILSSGSDLRKFASGFGRSDSLFSFVDVGYGKDKADHKCREMLKLMLQIPSCRRVFFGPCRDNGYLTLLEEYKHDQDIKEKLSLFTAEPAEAGFVQLGFDIVNFPTIFRSEPLNNLSSFHTSCFDFGTQHVSPVSAAGLSRSSFSADGSFDAPNASPVTPMISSPTSSAGNNSGLPPPTWAAISKISNGPVIDLYTKKARPAKPKFILLNTVNQRVDDPLPPVDSSALRSIDVRAQIQGRNLCNFYHLVGSCDKGDSCEYQHDVEPCMTTSERTALRHKARQIVCPGGQWCQSSSCLSGHHCKNIHDGQVCHWGARCFFKETHEVDVTPTMKILEDGTREDLTLQPTKRGA